MNRNRIGVCTLSFRMLELEPALDEIKALGCTGVDLWQVSPYYDNHGHVASDAPASDVDRVKTLLGDRDLHLVHLASYPGMKFRGASEDERQADIAWGKATIDLCSRLASPIMRCLPGPGERLDELDSLVESMQVLADYAATREIKLVFETHGGGPIMQTESIQLILDGVARDNVGLLYDPGNLAANALYRKIPQAFADRIVHVHLKSVDLGSGAKAIAWADPDGGAVDFDWVLNALNDIGYDGAFAIEYENYQASCTVEEVRTGVQSWVDFLATR